MNKNRQAESMAALGQGSLVVSKARTVPFLPVKEAPAPGIAAATEVATAAEIAPVEVNTAKETPAAEAAPVAGTTPVTPALQD